MTATAFPVAPAGTFLSLTGRPISRTTAAIRTMAVGASLFVPEKTSAQIGGKLRPVGAYSTQKIQQDGVTGVLVTRLAGPECNGRLKNHAPRLLALVIRAAQQFEFYAEQHAAKGTPDADAKAQVNRDLAADLRAAAADAVGGPPA